MISVFDHDVILHVTDKRIERSFVTTIMKCRSINGQWVRSLSLDGAAGMQRVRVICELAVLFGTLHILLVLMVQVACLTQERRSIHGTRSWVNKT